METASKTGATDAPEQKHEALDVKVFEVQGQKQGDGTSIQSLGSGSFSFYATFRGSGDTKVDIPRNGITPNSRVFVSASEYNADPASSRFIGGAKITVNNVAPYTNGVGIWVNVGWPLGLNVRLDILVDP